MSAMDVAPYTGELINGLIQIADEAHESLVMDRCEFVFNESSGPAAGLRCTEKAPVFNLADEREYCGKHFKEVNRG